MWPRLSRRADVQLHHQPGTAWAGVAHRVGATERPEDAQRPRRAHPDGDVLVRGEVDQREDGHHPLTDREVLRARSQGAWASPAAVVEQVVAVWRHAQLAQPAE